MTTKTKEHDDGNNLTDAQKAARELLGNIRLTKPDIQENEDNPKKQEPFFWGPTYIPFGLF